MKKFLAMAATAFSGFALLAAESASGIDTSAVDTLLGNIKTDLSGWVTAALPVLGGIAAVFMVFWLGKVAFRVLKAWANKAG